jgi:hypothetical protein
MAEYLREIGEHIKQLPVREYHKCVRKYHKVDKHNANGDHKSQRRTIEIILLQSVP